MRAEILAALQGDTTLAGLLHGGLHDGLIVGEISRQTTPAAFDEFGELQPCALVKVSSDRPIGPVYTGAMLGVTVYLYERQGVDAIDAARMRIYALLHRQRIAPASGGAWEIVHGEDLIGLYDDALRAALIVCRYRIPIRKTVVSAPQALLLETGEVLLMETGEPLYVED